LVALVFHGRSILAAPVGFESVWDAVVGGIPAEFEPGSESRPDPFSAEQRFAKLTEGSRGMPGLTSSLELQLTQARPPNPLADARLRAGYLARQREQAHGAGHDLVEIGEFAAFDYPEAPKPPAQDGSPFRRPPPEYYGPMTITVVRGEWSFSLSLDAHVKHLGYEEAKGLTLGIARTLDERLRAALEGPRDGKEDAKRALQYASRIVLDSGARVAEDLDDAAAWQEYIDAEMRARNLALPAGFDGVAAVFRDVGETMTLSDGRKMNWPALLVQSLHETGFYKYGRRANAGNFNVAGLGITEEDATTTRQKFKDLPEGVTAFFQHMSVYATGLKVERPLAERTRLVQGTVSERIVNFLGKFPLRGPISLRDLGSQFAGDVTTARAWSGLPEKTPDEEHLARLRSRIAKQFETYGGGTLAYSGDPLYAGKVMDLWVAATARVREIAEENRRMAGR
jgi:hypothetical protein